jgi:hypothetical protein
MWKTMQRFLHNARLIVQALWSLCMFTAAGFSYSSTSVPGTDGASILPLQAFSLFFTALGVVCIASCLQTLRQGPGSKPFAWIAMTLASEVLMLLALTIPPGFAIYEFYSGGLLMRS